MMRRLPYGRGRRQYVDLLLPSGAGPHPVVVALHGGFWRSEIGSGTNGRLCAALCQLGIASWDVEYRCCGDRGGGWPGTFHDVDRAVALLSRAAPRFQLDLSRVIAMGFSAGGHLALWLAARHRVRPDSPIAGRDGPPLRGVLSLAGVTDLRQTYSLSLSGGIARRFLGGTPADVPDRYTDACPSALLPLGVRQVLVHGADDDSVPVDFARTYAERAAAAGDQVELTILPATGHFDLLDPSSHAWPTIRTALLRLLG